ncbi:MAG TPA: 2-oxoacid:acceptor oxidoreductase subunit alpha [Anaerolineales bacterium]|nr:2-oxoacid:acceptor oxidoreductase subunit alpha [Anaerolineales bacterium]
MSSKKIINDFSITIATVNGSGSQTANVTLLRALFKMGIPISGKNLFPSNIQGLPTWYTIRLSKDGFLARRDEQEVVVAINPSSFARDLAAVSSGGVFFYADDIKLPIDRKDISVYPMPIKALAKAANVSPALRDYIANMVYVGVLAQMLGIDPEAIKSALDFHFKGKAQAVDSNFSTIQAGFDWAAQNLVKKDPYWIKQMDGTSGYIMTDGNTAAALGAIYGGVQFAAWYPITPASSLAESLNVYLPQLRKTSEGKQTYAVLQAEDEIAAIGMAVGAGWSGLRAMTSTSGPGISLMTEYAGLAYQAEIPVVVWDVQRIGPSTGLPTRTAQGDLTEVYFLGHGDTQNVILLPGSVQECFEFGWKAFDLAERLQAPVFVLSDLDLGMNQWMTKPFEYPDAPMDRGKILWEADLEKLNNGWSRYKDVDGDGIPYRTVTGNRHPAAAYFTRGTGHDENARYTEDAKPWEANMARLKKKYDTARTLVPKPVISQAKGATIGIIAFGSTEAAVKEAQALLAQEKGPKSDFMRLRALPCTREAQDFIKKHDRLYIVEANRDGQLRQILSAVLPDHANKFRSVAHTDGMPLTAKWVKETILAQENK